MAIVAFDVQTFLGRYPEFNTYNAANPNGLAALFLEAGLYLSNTDASPVQNLVKRTLLLNMVTAHLAYLNGALSADGQPRPVGLVSSASEGSVSVSFDNGSPSGSESWWGQSPFGYAFWQATLNLRRARYIPGPAPQLNGIYGPGSLNWRGRY